MKNFKIFISSVCIASLCLTNILAKGYLDFAEAAEKFENQDFQGAAPRMLALAQEGNLSALAYLPYLQEYLEPDQREALNTSSLITLFREGSFNSALGFEDFQEMINAEYNVSLAIMNLRYPLSQNHKLKMSVGSIVATLFAASRQNCGRAFFWLSQFYSNCGPDGKELPGRVRTNLKQNHALYSLLQGPSINQYPLFYGYLNYDALAKAQEFLLPIDETTLSTLNRDIARLAHLKPQERLGVFELTKTLVTTGIVEHYRRMGEEALRDQEFYHKLLDYLREYKGYTPACVTLFQCGGLLGDPKCLLVLSTKDVRPGFQNLWFQILSEIRSPMSKIKQGITLYHQWSNMDKAGRGVLLEQAYGYLEEGHKLVTPEFEEKNPSLGFELYTNMATILLRDWQKGNSEENLANGATYLRKSHELHSKLEDEPMRMGSLKFLIYLGGLQYLRAQKFDEALKAFGSAYRLGHHPSFEEWISAAGSAHKMEELFSLVEGQEAKGVRYLKQYLNHLQSLGSSSIQSPLSLLGQLSSRTLHVLTEHFIIYGFPPNEDQNLPPLEQFVEASKRKSGLIGLNISYLYHHKTQQWDQVGIEAPALLEQSLDLSFGSLVNQTTEDFLNHLKDRELIEIIGPNQIKGTNINLSFLRLVLNSLGWGVYMRPNNSFENDRIAVSLLKKAGRLGDLLAAYNLGLMFKDGRGGLKAGLDHAIECLKMALPLEDKDVYYDLALLLSKKYCLSENKGKEEKLFRDIQQYLEQAIRAGHPLATYSKAILAFHYWVDKGQSDPSLEEYHHLASIQASIIIQELIKIIQDQVIDTHMRTTAASYLYMFILGNFNMLPERISPQAIDELIIASSLSTEDVKRGVIDYLTSQTAGDIETSSSAASSVNSLQDLETESKDEENLEETSSTEIDEKDKGNQEEDFSTDLAEIKAEMEEARALIEKDRKAKRANRPGSQAERRKAEATASSSSPISKNDIIDSILREMPGLQDKNVRRKLQRLDNGTLRYGSMMALMEKLNVPSKAHYPHGAGAKDKQIFNRLPSAEETLTQRATHAGLAIGATPEATQQVFIELRSGNIFDSL